MAAKKCDTIQRRRVAIKKGGNNMKCAEKINEELAGRISDFENGLKRKDFTAWINSYALSYDDDPDYRGKRLELSCGGPQDYFIFHDDGTISYHYLDWFDGAEVELAGKDYEVMAKVREALS